MSFEPIPCPLPVQFVRHKQFYWHNWEPDMITGTADWEERVGVPWSMFTAEWNACEIALWLLSQQYKHRRASRFSV